jgi:GNAT superfamily N-acetyltransferase
MKPAIRGLQPNDAEACDAIVAGLPYFFGDPGGIEQCRKAVRTQPGLVATDGGELVGFVTIARYPGTSAEITWMAIRADRRRQGVGRLLIERTAREMVAEGCSLLFVLTLGPSVPEDVEDSYAGTRAFYAEMGFIPLREFSLRDWSDEAALLLVLPLSASSLPAADKDASPTPSG